jgi:hypothetical protein
MARSAIRRVVVLVLAALLTPAVIVMAPLPANAVTNPHLCETNGRYCLGSADLAVGTYIQELSPGRNLILTPLGGHYGPCQPNGCPTYLIQFSSDNHKCVGTQSPGGGSLLIQPCNGGIGIVWAQDYIGLTSNNIPVYRYINRYQSQFYGGTRYLIGTNSHLAAFQTEPLGFPNGYFKFSWES